MFVIYGTYNNINGVIAYCEQEHNAIRLVDMLRNDDLYWEQIGYDAISQYRQNNLQWEYPFVVKYIDDAKRIVKPSFIDFVIIDEFERSKQYETSRTSQSGILPATREDDTEDQLRYLRKQRENAAENLGSRVRGRKRISRIKRKP